MLAGRVQAPQVLCDEFIYAELAESLAAGGGFRVRGEASLQSVVYPLLLAPAWLAESVPRAYELAKAINVVLVHAGALAVFLWGRRLVSDGWALTATALTLALPSLHLTGLLMTENAFLPAVLLAAWTTALSLERPTLARQALAAAAIAVATGVRAQGIVLAAALVLAVCLMAAFEAAGARPRERIAAARGRFLAHWPSGLVLLLGAAAYGLGRELRGASFLGGFGPLGSVGTVDYTYAETQRWALLHAAELTVSIAVVPLAALVLLLGLGLSGRLDTPARRAFVAVSAATVPLMLIAVGAFASRFAGSVAGRYTFVLAPLLLLALAVWLGSGAPRPPVPTALAVVLPVALVGSQSLQPYYALNLVPSTFSTYVFFRLGQRLDGGVERVADLVLGGAIVGVVALALLWRPALRVVLPAALLVFLAASSRPPFGLLAGQARAVRSAPGVSQERPDWVDQTIGGDADATFLYAVPPGGDPFFTSTVMLQVGFWNRGVRSVTNLGTREVCPLPERDAIMDDATGLIATPGGDELRPSHVVSAGTVTPDGQELGGESFVRVLGLDGPLRIASRWDGRFGDRWIGALGSYTRYTTPGDRPATAVVTVSRPEWSDGPPLRSAVRVDVGPAEPDGAGGLRLARVESSRQVEIGFGDVRSVELDAPPAPFRVEIHVDETFVPAEHGAPDTNTLGAQVAVEVRARGG